MAKVFLVRVEVRPFGALGIWEKRDFPVSAWSATDAKSMGYSTAIAAGWEARFVTHVTEEPSRGI